MNARLVCPRRAPALGLVAGAAIALCQGLGEHRGLAAEPLVPTPAPSAAPPVSARTHVADPLPQALQAPSEDFGVPELLARELVPESTDPGELDGDDEDDGPLPHTPLAPGEAARLLEKAWEGVTGQALGEDGLAVIWSHWALETGRGERMVGFNFGGLKGQSPEGGTVRLWTRERRDDELTLVRRRFRAYPGAAAGARDYVELLHARYPRACRAVERGSVVDFVLGLAERGYFTDDPDRYLRAMRSLSREFLEGAVGAPAETSSARSPVAERTGRGSAREI